MRVSQAVRDHLKFLEVNGRLTPDRVVEDAKREDSPLHPYFEWDLQKAASEHWRDQARELIRTVQVKVIINDYSIKAPYYVPDPSRASGREQGYTSIEMLRQDPNMAKQSLLSECERAAGGLRRARIIAASLGLEEHIDAILAHITGVRQRLDEGNGPTPPQ
jgi:hypothetical protein